MRLIVEVRKQEKIGELGIFALKDIKKGETVEICPLILLPINEMEFIDKTKLKTYYFDYDKDFIAIVLGYGSLYNHSYSSNADFDMDFKAKTMNIVCTKDINKDEEIFLNYNGYPNDKTPLHKWFDPNFKDLLS